MKRRKLIFLPRALADLDEIGLASDRSWGRVQTRNYLRTLHDTADKLRSLPGAGSDCSHIMTGLRRRRAGRHLIFYLSSNDEVWIVRILHERMEAEAHLTSPIDDL